MSRDWRRTLGAVSQTMGVHPRMTFDEAGNFARCRIGFSGNLTYCHLFIAYVLLLFIHELCHFVQKLPGKATGAVLVAFNGSSRRTIYRPCQRISKWCPFAPLGRMPLI